MRPRQDSTFFGSSYSPASREYVSTIEFICARSPPVYSGKRAWCDAGHRPSEVTPDRRRGPGFVRIRYLIAQSGRLEARLPGFGVRVAQPSPPRASDARPGDRDLFDVSPLRRPRAGGVPPPGRGGGALERAPAV